MAFPSTPTNLQQYTNPLGTVYQYDSTKTCWNIVGLSGGGAGVVSANYIPVTNPAGTAYINSPLTVSGSDTTAAGYVYMGSGQHLEFGGDPDTYVTYNGTELLLKGRAGLNFGNLNGQQFIGTDTNGIVQQGAIGTDFSTYINVLPDATFAGDIILSDSSKNIYSQGEAYQNWFPSCSLIGYASTYYNTLAFQKTGRKVDVVFYFDGSGTSTTVEFQLPYAKSTMLDSSGSPQKLVTAAGACRDDGTWSIGTIQVSGDWVNVVPTTMTTQWTPGGQRVASGQFFYYTD